ncbi:MAG: hypothetical protein JWP87_5317 [Labilithrix sp.]|nr:hypothetical protein [Labilithrix sp.]
MIPHDTTMILAALFLCALGFFGGSGRAVRP